MRLVLFLLVVCLYSTSADDSSVSVTQESIMVRLAEMELKFHQQEVKLNGVTLELEETKAAMKKQESELVQLKQSSAIIPSMDDKFNQLNSSIVHQIEEMLTRINSDQVVRQKKQNTINENQKKTVDQLKEQVADLIREQENNSKGHSEFTASTSKQIQLIQTQMETDRNESLITTQGVKKLIEGIQSRMENFKNSSLIPSLQELESKFIFFNSFESSIRALDEKIIRAVSKIEEKESDELKLTASDQQVNQSDKKVNDNRKSLESFAEELNGTVTELVKKLDRCSVIGRMPTNCQELRCLGHSNSGFYLVKSSRNPKKIETIFCDFAHPSTASGFETRIGYNDIKSSSNGVYFYVQKNKSNPYSKLKISFDVERLNVGGAMNTGTGIFIAPVDGIYYFSFSAVKSAHYQHLEVYLQLNNVNVGIAYTWEHYKPHNLVVSLSSTLALKKGDEVRLYLEGGMFTDDWRHHTHFTGWLLQEDLILQ